MRKTELYPHNKKTFDNIKFMIERGDKRIGIVQPTGTGKSYLIVEILRYIDTDSVILLSPSNHINQQIININSDSFAGKTFLTYSKLSVMTNEELRGLNPKMIILDEFHRCGAEVWGLAVQNLLDMNPDAIVIGTTATPIRYLDGAKDMGEALFDNNLAVNMTLADAIIEGLLPVPKYITALYDFTEAAEATKKMIYNSKNSESEKKELLKKVELAKNHLGQSHGVPSILKKYFNLEYPKTIVFCKNKEHLDEMKPIVIKWFTAAFKNHSINSYVIQSDLGDNENVEALNAFKVNDEGISILFAINILNEGIHIESVKNLIFLRKSVSPIIVRQQTGRALNAGMDAVPVIFDLVNNIRNIGAKWLSDEVKESVIATSAEGMRDIPEFDVYDELIDVERAFNEIESQLIFSWDKYYELLLKFKERFGHVDIPRRYIDDESNLCLGQWLSTQRINYKKSILSHEKKTRLEAAGIDLERDYFNDHWNEMYQELIDFYETHSHLLIPSSDKYKVLNNWCRTQRSDFRKNRLSKEREVKLRRINFEFNYESLKFNHLLNLYIEAHSNGVKIDTTTTSYNGKNLYHWVLKTRKLYEKNRLSSSVVKKLNAINFQWSNSYTSDEERWELLEDWLNENSVEDLTIYTSHKGYGLGQWYYSLKVDARNDELSDEILKKLEKVGFKPDKYADVMWEKATDLYQKYINGESLSESEVASIKNWEVKQRRKWKDKSLPKEKIDHLKEIGFVFSVDKSKSWDESFEIMKSYHEEFGSCDVVKGTIYHDYKLYEWVIYQRKLYNKGKLGLEQVNKLNEIDFIWDKKAHDWMNMYNALKEYYTIHGHSNPLRGHTYKGYNLGDWARTQRDRYRSNRINIEEKELLDKISFQW